MYDVAIVFGDLEPNCGCECYEVSRWGSRCDDDLIVERVRRGGEDLVGGEGREVRGGLEW